MKLNFIIILSFILSALSLKEPNQCFNCKFYKASGDKCLLFPIIKYTDYNLNNFSIDNFKKKILVYDFRRCIVAREYDYMCGKNGKMYEEDKNK